MGKKRFERNIGDALSGDEEYAGYYDYAAEYYARIDGYEAFAPVLAGENSRRIFGLLPEEASIRRIVDFGCGNGLILKFVSEQCRSGLAVGMDVSPFQLSLAKRDFPRGHFLVGTEELFDAIRVHADVILFVDILEHLKDPGRMLRIAKGKTKYIAIVQIIEKTGWRKAVHFFRRKEMRSRYYESLGHLHIWDKSDFLRLLRENGLHVTRYRLLNYPNALLFHPYLLAHLRTKKGFLGVLKYRIYQLFSILPDRISNWILEEINGTFMYCLCGGDSPTEE